MRHSDYSTSEYLTAFFDSGGNAVFVESDAGIVALRLVPARGATR